MITYDEFKKVELKVATILEAQRVEGSDKLVKLQIDLGVEFGQRQIVAGIGLAYTPEELVGKQVIVVANLEPKTLMGQESQGMLLAASQNGKAELSSGLPILLTPDKPAPNGCEVK